MSLVGILLASVGFVVGILLFAQAWSVMDAKLATAAGAREAARAYVEAPPDASASAAHAAALAAGRSAADAHGGGRSTTIRALAGAGAFERCQRVVFEASQEVSAIPLPFLRGATAFTVTSTHSEVVDPFRDGLEGELSCVG